MVCLSIKIKSGLRRICIYDIPLKLSNKASWTIFTIKNDTVLYQ